MLKHNSNGRFVVVCGEGEYIIYTALAWRNKSFGTGLEFVWGNDTGEYAVRESTSKVKIFQDFKEAKAIRPNFSAEGIHGGLLLAVRSNQFVVFYDWAEGRIVRKIDVTPKAVRRSLPHSLLSSFSSFSSFSFAYCNRSIGRTVASW